MNTLGDLLCFYNKRDVLPMIGGLETLMSFYEKKGVCIFKECISIAGIARKLLFQTAREEGAVFPLFSTADRDLQEVVEAGLVGGPAITFCRYQEAGVTRIRGGESAKLCKSIHGYDCNSLYLGALGEPQMVWNYIRRRAQNGFRAERRQRDNMASFVWMDFIAMREGVDIEHYANTGREAVILGHRVDGWCPETNSCYDYDGCW
jgi:hypothetical protein